MSEVLENNDFDRLIELIENNETSSHELTVKIGFAMGILEFKTGADHIQSVSGLGREYPVYAPWWGSDRRNDYKFIVDRLKIPNYATSLDAVMQLVDRRQEGIVFDTLKTLSTRFDLDRMEKYKDMSLTEYLAKAVIVELLHAKKLA